MQPYLATCCDRNTHHHYTSLVHISITHHHVQEKLNHLNVYKSTGPDLPHPRVLRTLEDMLCEPLNHIFNKSAETGISPADWKSANVTAIHKKGNRHEPGNYRPISLTSVVRKTMERLIKGKIIAHL